MCGDMVPGLQYKEKKMLVPLRPMIHLCLKTFKAPMVFPVALSHSSSTLNAGLLFKVHLRGLEKKMAQ